jgi:hypothetical protein
MSRPSEGKTLLPREAVLCAARVIETVVGSACRSWNADECSMVQRAIVAQALTPLSCCCQASPVTVSGWKRSRSISSPPS